MVRWAPWLPIIGLGLAVVSGCDQSSEDRSPSESARTAAGERETESGTAQSGVAQSSSAEFSSPQERPESRPVDVTAADDRSLEPASGPMGDQRPAAPVFRPDDTRARHDDKLLARGGVRHAASQRLSLYTDIDAQASAGLLPAVESLYAAWTEYFGALPPNRAKTDFQITGYLISDRERFDRLGLVPVDLPPFSTGRHRGAEFWMLNPREGYYRHHLLLHEATHCFMTFLEPSADPRPGWYLEGMAELFATHRRRADGRFDFRVMPHNKVDFAGLGRITALQRELQDGPALTLSQATSLPATEYLSIRGYAWSWAVCYFLDAHPDYHERFRALGRQTSGSSFRKLLSESFESELPKIEQQWAVFIDGLCDGYDVPRSAFDLSRTGLGFDQPFSVRSDRGWQSTGLVLRKGRAYRLRATGRTTLAQQPKPWISEPQGISFRYVADRPIGRLLLALRVDGDARSMLKIVAAGSDQVFRPTATGVVYLRVNDAWSELSDNTGAYTARVSLNDPLTDADD